MKIFCQARSHWFSMSDDDCGLGAVVGIVSKILLDCVEGRPY